MRAATAGGPGLGAGWCNRAVNHVGKCQTGDRIDVDVVEYSVPRPGVCVRLSRPLDGRCDAAVDVEQLWTGGSPGPFFKRTRTGALE